MFSGGPYGPQQAYIHVEQTDPGRFFRAPRFRVAVEWHGDEPGSCTLDDIKGEGVADSIAEVVVDQLNAGRMPDVEQASIDAFAW